MDGTCSTCGEPLAADDAFCGGCGARQAPPPPRAGLPVPNLATPAASSVTIARDVPEPVADIGVPAWPGSGAGAAGTWLAGAAGMIPPDAAVGRGRSNANRLGYSPGADQSFDPLGNAKLLRQYLINLLVYLGAYFIGGFVAFIFFGILAFASRSLAPLVLYEFAAALFSFLFACLFWLVPSPAQLSEWRHLVDDQGAAAPMVFERISAAIGRHQTPLDSLRVRPLALAGGQSRDYLELHSGLFTAYICCFAYGQDLFVGWTFWVRASPARLIFMGIARIWQILTVRGSDLHTTLRYDYAKAMREAVHSVAREGTDLAISLAGDPALAVAVPAQARGV